MGKATSIILVRHGLTDWNVEKRYQGHSDVPLNGAGHEQARLVADRLAKVPVSAVYSSDLTRAAETAAEIAARHKQQVALQPGFRELNFGFWEGLTYGQIMLGWPNWLTAMYARPSVGYAPGGENFTVLARRSLEALRSCLVEHPGETIVIVAHGGTVRAMLCRLLGKSLDQVWSLRQEATAVNILKCHDGACELQMLNDTSHLAV